MLKPGYFHKGFHLYEKSVNEIKSRILLVSTCAVASLAAQSTINTPFRLHGTPLKIPSTFTSILSLSLKNNPSSRQDRDCYPAFSEGETEE